jgi:hypothetical protein
MSLIRPGPWAASGSSGEINAASLSAADIQTAVNAASSGQIVRLPAGTRTTTAGENVVVNKYVRILGAGGGRCEGKSLTSNTIGTGSKSFTIVSGTVPSMLRGRGPGWTVGGCLRRLLQRAARAASGVPSAVRAVVV